MEFCEPLLDSVLRRDAHPAFHTQHFDRLAVLWKLENCASLCGVCRSALQDRVVLESRHARFDRVFEREFHGICLESATNGTSVITTRDCPIPTSVELAIKLLQYDDPRWWPRLVQTYTDLFRVPSSAGENTLWTETEWSLKLWYALDGVYSIEDAVYRERDRGAWERTFVQYLQAATKPSIAQCGCAMRHVRLCVYGNAWINLEHVRLQVLGPFMAEHAPGLNYEPFIVSGDAQGAKAAMIARAADERKAVTGQARDHLGRRGEWITGRMERWIEAHEGALPWCVGMCGTELPDIQHVAEQTPQRTVMRREPVGSAPRTEQTHKPPIFQGSIPRPVPLRPAEAQLMHIMQRAIDRMLELIPSAPDCA
jgi:hypothetical protein